MLQEEELKEISFGSFRAVLEFGAGGDHSPCPEAFGVTLRTPLEGKRTILSWNFLGCAHQGVWGSLLHWVSALLTPLRGKHCKFGVISGGLGAQALGCF